jgi:hypothetical protein
MPESGRGYITFEIPWFAMAASGYKSFTEVGFVAVIATSLTPFACFGGY